MNYKFWKNRALLMRRAWQIKKRRDVDRTAEGAFHLLCLFSACLSMAWSEFKNNCLWVPIEEIIERSGKRMTVVHGWLHSGILIGQKVKNRWWINAASLEEYLERRADTLIKDGYLTLKAAAEKVGWHYLAFWKAVQAGCVDADKRDGQILVHKGVLSRCKLFSSPCLNTT